MPRCIRRQGLAEAQRPWLQAAGTRVGATKGRGGCKPRGKQWQIRGWQMCAFIVPSPRFASAETRDSVDTRPLSCAAPLARPLRLGSVGTMKFLKVGRRERGQAALHGWMRCTGPEVCSTGSPPRCCSCCCTCVQQGKVVIVLGGRYAGKKAVIVKNYDDGTGSRPYGHALVCGLSKEPRKVGGVVLRRGRRRGAAGARPWAPSCCRLHCTAALRVRMVGMVEEMQQWTWAVWRAGSRCTPATTSHARQAGRLGRHRPSLTWTHVHCVLALSCVVQVIKRSSKKTQARRSSLKVCSSGQQQQTSVLFLFSNSWGPDAPCT